jgi:hypothetical protein
MNENTPQIQPPSSIKHRVLLVIACIAAIFVVGAGMVFLLRTLTVTKDESGGQQGSAPSAAQMVKEYSKPDAIKALSPATFTAQENSDADAIVIYKSSGNSYAVDTPTKEKVLFYAKDLSVANNKTAVQEQTTQFMETKGYSKTENSGGATSESPSYITYESKGAVCQLSSSPADTVAKSPAFHKLSCIEKTAIQNEYVAVKSLLDLYGKDNKNEDFNEVIRSTKSEGNKSLAVLSLVADKKATSLLFAAIDKNWAYIGSLSDGTAVSNGKYTISPETRQVINDPKYGDFLKKNIQ